MDAEQRAAHEEIIDKFLKYLSVMDAKFVLKGGTALMKCYGLDRFSEDIDLDGDGVNFIEICEQFCKEHNFSGRVAKNTDTVKRFMIHYSESFMAKPLKIELSARRQFIPQEETVVINGILTYRLDMLAGQKCQAYTSRDKIRDLYDITFICNNYFTELSAMTIQALRGIVEYKGLEQFDYLVTTQKDELIDEEKLEFDFLTMIDKLGLLYTEEEKARKKELRQQAEGCIKKAKHR